MQVTEVMSSKRANSKPQHFFLPFHPLLLYFICSREVLEESEVSDDLDSDRVDDVCFEGEEEEGRVY